MKRSSNETRFKPGVSGNPGGRTKASKAAVELAKYVRDQTSGGVELVDFMLAVLRGEPSGPAEDAEPWDAKSRCWAAQQLLDRGFGKPQQHIEITTGGEAAPLPEASGLTLEELRLRVAEAEASDDDDADRVH